jgi:hypothetical protein
MPVCLDERSTGPDHRRVQINRGYVPMQIKSILAAAVAIAFMIQGWTAIAAAQDSRIASEIFTLQAQAGDMPEAKTEGKTEVKSTDDPEATSDGQTLTKPQKQVTTVSVRNTRPRTDRHKDARACLDAGNNEAIIRCAQKYR